MLENRVLYIRPLITHSNQPMGLQNFGQRTNFEYLPYGGYIGCCHSFILMV